MSSKLCIFSPDLGFKGDSDSEHILLLDCTLSLVPQGFGRCSSCRSCYLKLESDFGPGVKSSGFLGPESEP